MAEKGFLSHVHEGPLLEGLRSDELQMLRDRLDDTNIVVARSMSPVMGMFVFILWFIDFKRAQLGILQTSFLYQFHAGAHVAYAVGVLPSVLFWFGHRIGRQTQRWMLWFHIVVMTGSVLLMALASMYERHGLVLLGVAMLIANLMYQVPRKPRMAFNFLALAIFTMMVFAFDERGELAVVIQFGEMLALVSTATVVGGLHSRHRLASMLAEHRLAQMAMLDALTGVASRRRLDEVLQRELSSVARGRQLSVVLIDVDRFKSVNDRFGHDVGDDVLRGVARVLQQEGRLSDVVGRWGGEEFLVVCTDTDGVGATVVSERAAERLRAARMPPVGQVTASFGVAQALPGESARELIARADKALYRAKETGRDRVVVAP